MAQHDMNIANQGFPATRADLNNALQALVSNSSGTSAPTTTFANQWWYDTTNNKMYIRNEANNAWIEVFTLDQTNNEWQLTTGVVQAKDSDGLALKTDDGTTRLFIKDSDGTISIGHTSPVRNLDVQADGVPPFRLNRITSDGNISEFRKAGTTVGSISVDADGTTYKTAGTGGAEFGILGPSSTVFASSGFSAVTTNSNGGAWNLGSIALPSSGLWVLMYQSRFGFQGHTAYHHVAMSTSSSSSDIFGTYRMIAERVGTEGASNANISGSHFWNIDVANGNTSGKTIYIIAQQSGAATASFFQDDGNGQTGIIAWKLRESSTSGTGVTNVGF